jgi:XTP/dITP diphosphohydrolase
VEETGSTYLENARLKGMAGAAALDVPALADDSGIEVDALGGRPGPRSARFAGEDATDDRNLQELIRSMKGVPGSGRTARYRCVALLAYPDGREVYAEGVCEGTLVSKPRGAGGFGYDPIFVPAGWDRTMAELTDDEKDRISHRGRALRALRELVGTP